MKNKLFFLSILLLSTAAFTFTSCDKDEDPVAPELSINVTPLLADVKPGETVDYTIVVAGDLSSVTLNGDAIKTYTDQTFEDTIQHSYTFPETADSDMEVTFAVNDKGGQMVDFPVLIGFIQPDYSLADFSVKTADTAAWSDWWEGLDIYGYPGATYSGGDASDEMYVTCRGSFASDDVWNFSADLPDNMGTGLMMSREAIMNDDGTTAWGGFMISVLGYYGPGMTQPDLQQLNQVESGTRVVAVDVYFETDASSPISFDDISIDNNGNGAKFQFRFGNHQKFVESGDKGGWFVIKEAFVTEPDKWVTLYFSSNDDEEINKVDDDGNTVISMDGTADEVNFAWLVPAYGTVDYDTHKIYLKNFRITNLPE